MRIAVTVGSGVAIAALGAAVFLCAHDLSWNVPGQQLDGPHSSLHESLWAAFGIAIWSGGIIITAVGLAAWCGIRRDIS
jgi:hypothetical protein